MFKLLAVLALVSASVAHRYLGAEYKQTKKVENYEHKDVTWDEAHEYKECPEFDDNYVEGQGGEEALNGMDRYMSRHIPKPISDICDFTKRTCPKFTRKSSGHCGFETVTIPSGYWMVADIDKCNENLKFLVRSAYKEKIFYGYRAPNRLRFVTPVILKWHLDEDGNRVRGEIAMYIPDELQSNPPPSKSDKVRVEMWEKTTVYLRPYGGYRDDEAFGKQFGLLRRALTDADVSYDSSIEMEAGYTYLRYGRQRIEAMVVAGSSSM